MLRDLLIKASTNPVLRHQVETNRLSRPLAMRFVAGETLEAGMAVSRRLAAQGKSVTLDYLGEAVTEPSEARAAAKAVLEALDRIGQEGLDAGVSIKPTQMGLGLPGEEGGELCRELVGDVVAAAERIGAHVTLDMEGHDVTEATIALVEQFQAAGHTVVGCAVQTYLRRTRRDVERLSAAGASVRLCKGAYAEPPSIAYQSRLEVDVSFADCACFLLANGTFPRLATHDDRLIERAKADARRLGRRRRDFEFQMLYGVRTALQDQLVADGYGLRVYVPFGGQWYPYFMRRLAERPANVLFLLRALRG